MSDTTPHIQYAQSDTPQPWTVAVGFIGLRLLGVYFLVQTLTLLTFLISSMIGYRPRTWAYDEQTISGLVVAVLPGVVGTVLIVCSKQLAVALFSLPGASPARVESEQVVRLGTVLIGLWLAAGALPQIVRTVIDIIESIRQNFDSSVVQSPGWIFLNTPLLDYLLPFIVGVALFLRPGWVVGQFRKRSRI